MILWDKPLLYSANEEKLPESQTGNGGPDKGLPATGDEWKQVPSGFKAQGKWYQKKGEGSKINYSDEKPSGKEGGDEGDESSVNPLLESALEFIRNGGTPKGYQRVQGPNGQTMLWAVDEEGEGLGQQYHPEHERELEEEDARLAAEEAEEEPEEEIEEEVIDDPEEEDEVEVIDNPQEDVEPEEIEEPEIEEEEELKEEDWNIFEQNRAAEEIARKKEIAEIDSLIRFGDLPNYDETDPDFDLYEKWKDQFKPNASGRDINQKAVAMVMAMASGKITKQEYDKMNNKFFNERFNQEQEPEEVEQIEEEPEEEEIEEEAIDEPEEIDEEDEEPLSFAEIARRNKERTEQMKKKGKK